MKIELFLTNQLVIGKNSLDQNYCVEIRKNEFVFFHPSSKKHFAYLLVNLCHHILQKDPTAYLLVYANNASINAILSDIKSENISCYFHFEPEKSNYANTLAFFKKITNLSRIKSVNTYWIIEDVLQIIRLKKTKGASEFLKLITKPSNTWGIISGYTPFKHLIKQMMESARPHNEHTLMNPELYFTPDELLFFKTSITMDHIYYDQSIMNNLSGQLEENDQNF